MTFPDSRLEYVEDPCLPSYGAWRCNGCRSEFYGGGPAIHEDGCIAKGYETCRFVFGPLAIAESETSDSLLPPGVTRDRLRNFWRNQVKMVAQEVGFDGVRKDRLT